MVLLDCDVAVTNASIKAHDIWQQWGNSSTAIMMARDAWWQRGSHHPFNTGGVFIKDTLWTRQLLDDILKHNKVKSPKYGSQHHLVDQPRVIDELHRRGEIDIPPVGEFELHEHVSIVSQRVFNSFYRKGKMYKETDSQDSRWREGDWLAHATGMPNKRRFSVMMELGLCKNITLPTSDPISTSTSTN